MGTVYISRGVIIKIPLLIIIITTITFYALRYGPSLFLSEFSTVCEVVPPLAVFIIPSFP